VFSESADAQGSRLLISQDATPATGEQVIAIRIEGEQTAHYDSLQKLKNFAKPEQLFLTGHDSEGGRVCSWKTQLEVNPSLRQDRETFVREAGAYVGPSPKLLKESLFENLK
jgi:glyoxylase-like metal-dependent hydrolase (beta-lactamase superfamily II)